MCLNGPLVLLVVKIRLIPSSSSRVCGFVEHLPKSLSCKPERARDIVKNMSARPHTRSRSLLSTAVHRFCNGRTVDMLSIAKPVASAHDRRPFSGSGRLWCPSIASIRFREALTVLHRQLPGPARHFSSRCAQTHPARAPSSWEQRQSSLLAGETDQLVTAWRESCPLRQRSSFCSSMAPKTLSKRSRPTDGL